MILDGSSCLSLDYTINRHSFMPLKFFISPKAVLLASSHGDARQGHKQVLAKDIIKYLDNYKNRCC